MDTFPVQNSSYFHNFLSEFVFLRTYAKWLNTLLRRESWPETVDRYVKFMRENLGKKLKPKEYDEIQEAILNQEVMPSMRLMQFAGKAARATHVCIYNCSYIVPTTLRDFGEIMYVLMCGVGVGFSVENKNVQMLPNIKYQTGEIISLHQIKDTKEGWCDALVLGLQSWFDGKDISFDFSKLRPKGSRLQTSGGR